MVSFISEIPYSLCIFTLQFMKRSLKVLVLGILAFKIKQIPFCYILKKSERSMNAEQHMCNIEKDTGGNSRNSSVFKLNHTCFVESSLLMRHGFLSTTQKPSARDVNGSLRRRRGRKKQDSQNQKSKLCWSLSSMSEASSPVSSCHRARRSISKFTKRSCGVLFRSVREKWRE